MSKPQTPTYICPLTLAPPPDPNKNTMLFVHGLPPNTRPQEIRHLFNPIPLTDIKIPSPETTYCFIFLSKAAAIDVLVRFADGVKFKGRTTRVCVGRENLPRQKMKEKKEKEKEQEQEKKCKHLSGDWRVLRTEDSPVRGSGKISSETGRETIDLKVTKIPEDAVEEDIRDLFAGFGLTKLVLCKKHAFVSVKAEEAGKAVQKGLEGLVHGKPVVVKVARPREH